MAGIVLSEAIQRVKDGLGFRVSTNLDDKITICLQDAVRDLEKGKTLPKFLLLENSSVNLIVGQHTAELDGRFLRDTDDAPLHYIPSGTNKPFFLKRIHRYIDAVVANTKTNNLPTSPKIYVLRKATIDFITTADKGYLLTWDYYVQSVILSNPANEWLLNAPDWIVGEAGMRIALNLRDKEAIELFKNMRDKGRAASFADQVALEESGAQYAMGADL